MEGSSRHHHHHHHVHSELLESVVHQLIDEEALGVCFEMHRAIRLGYYELLYPEDSVYEKQEIVDVKGVDIFGNTPQIMKKQVDCVCPNCERSLGAQKFAPHLEKCMGMGRNSSRLATKKQKTSPDSDQEAASEDNEDEWTYPERKPAKKAKKEKLVGSSPRRPGGRGPGRPPKHPRPEPPPEPPAGSELALKSSLQHNVSSFRSLSSDQKQALLRQMCAVVSERTGKLCTRSTNCPQHTDEQKSDVRKYLLGDRRGDVMAMPSAKRLKESSHKYSDVSDDVDIEGQYGLSSAPQPSSAAPLVSSNPGRKRKVKSGKRSKKGHSASGGGGAMHLLPPDEL